MGLPAEAEAADEPGVDDNSSVDFPSRVFEESEAVPEDSDVRCQKEARSQYVFTQFEKELEWSNFLKKSLPLPQQFELEGQSWDRMDWKVELPGDVHNLEKSF